MVKDFVDFLNEIKVGAIGLLLIISVILLINSGIFLQTLLYVAIAVAIVALWGEYFLPKQLRDWIKLGFATLSKKFIAYENKLYDRKESIELEAEIKKYKWKRIKHFFARILITFIATLFFIIEELFWELTFKRFFNWLEIFPWIQAKKDEIPKLHKYWILTLFLSCFVLMEIFGLGAPFVAYYSIILGLFVYSLKFLMIIPVKFIFIVGEPKLMQIEWFKARYIIVMKSLEWFKTTQSYVRVHNLYVGITTNFKEWFASDTSFVREVKVFFKSLKTWLESFAEISKKIEEEEMAKHNGSTNDDTNINVELDDNNNTEDTIFHVYVDNQKRTRKARNLVDAQTKAAEYRKIYKEANIVIKL